MLRSHFKKLVKYFFVGGAAACVDLSIFYFLSINLSYNYLLTGAFGFLLATWVNYVLCIKYIYISGQRFSGRGEIFGVYLASSVGLLMHELALYGFHEYFGAELMLAKILAIGLVFFWNFSIRNFYVFSKAV